MIKEFALQWPVLRQILQGGDGTGREAMSARTLSLRPKNEGAEIARSVFSVVSRVPACLIHHLPTSKLVFIAAYFSAGMLFLPLCP